jgi:hypothetical protein
MNKKTIIIITIYPFNEDYALKFGFDILKNRGFEIVVFNVYEILFRETVKEYKRIFAHGSQLGPVFGINQFEVKSVKDLRKCLNDIEGWKIAILACHPYLSILKVLKKAKVRYVRKFSDMGPPIPVAQRGYLGEIIRVLRLFVSFRRLFFYATNKIMPIFPRLFNVEHPEYVIVTSAASVPSYILSKTKVIYTHSFDYDRYLRNKDKPRPKIVPDEDYYVYLPAVFGDGFSSIMEKWKPSSLSRNELVEIKNRFLGFVEKMTGKKIIIATHPKHASSEWNQYEGRPFIAYETEQLIRYSSGVLSHGSFSIKFAIIHEKPLGFLAIRSLGHNYSHNLVCKVQASALGGRVHYIDTDNDLCQLKEEGIFSYNPDLYEDYKRKYIKCDNATDRLYWDVVADELLNEKEITGKKGCISFKGYVGS